MAAGKFYKYKKRTSEVKKLKRKVNKMMRNTENNHHDITNTAKPCANDVPVFSLSAIAQGDTSGTRHGLKISPTYLEVRAKVEYSSDKLLSGQPVRIIVFKDKDQAGVVPTIADLLEQADISSLFNNTNLKRFQILSDKLVFPTTALTADQLGNPFNIPFGYYSLKKKLSGQIRYLGSASTQASQGQNNIYAVCLGDTALGGNDTDLTWNSRLTFTDL